MHAWPGRDSVNDSQSDTHVHAHRNAHYFRSGDRRWGPRDFGCLLGTAVDHCNVLRRLSYASARVNTRLGANQLLVSACRVLLDVRRELRSQQQSTDRGPRQHSAPGVVVSKVHKSFHGIPVGVCLRFVVGQPVKELQAIGQITRGHDLT